jgi:UDP-3-O-[3-hydroxymyristoyl] glucosamine N-acyltransferase
LGDRRAILTAAEVATLTHGRVVGDPTTPVHAVAPLDRAGPGDLSYFSGAKYAARFAASQAGVTLVSPDLAEHPGPPVRIVVERPADAMLLVLPKLYRPPERVPAIHPTARIGRGVQLPPDTTIDAYAVIGDGAQIGARVWIGSHCVIGPGAILGDDVQLHPGVTVCSGTQLGHRVAVHSGARLGNDGFGYVFRDGRHTRIPHVGRCLIGDDVEIGANTTIDRGSVDDTVVGAGTKIDNLVHIAHNVQIGRLCLVMAQVGIAGSVRVEDGAILAGQVGVSGHVVIGARATLAGQAGVFGNVPAGETWSGYPARPHREATRAHAAMFKLPQIIRSLERLAEAEQRARSEKAASAPDRQPTQTGTP